MLETTFLFNVAMGSGLFVAPLLISGGLIGLIWLRLPRKHRAFVSRDERCGAPFAIRLPEKTLTQR